MTIQSHADKTIDVIEMIKRHEGFRSTPYRCTAGKLTIGYGLNLDAGITPREASLILVSRVNDIEQELSERLPFWKELDDNRQGVLVDMAYNLGIDGLMKFKNTLAMIGQGRYEEASRAMLASKWAGQVGDRANELAKIMAGGKP